MRSGGVEPSLLVGVEKMLRFRILVVLIAGGQSCDVDESLPEATP
jgi:hypothetical protein